MSDKMRKPMTDEDWEQHARDELRRAAQLLDQAAQCLYSIGLSPILPMDLFKRNKGVPLQHTPNNLPSGYISCSCGEFPEQHFATDTGKWEAFDKHVAESNMIAVCKSVD